MAEVRRSVGTWSCPNCPWSHHSHPLYGWGESDDRAVEVHQTMLCPSCVTCETRGPKWCDRHGALLIPPTPAETGGGQ